MIKFGIILLFCLTVSACELFIGVDGKRNDGFVNFDYVRDRISSSYALLEWKEQKNNFRWDVVAREERKRIKSEMPAEELMRVLAKDLLGKLKDAHVYFRLPPGSRLNGVTYEQDRFLGYYSGFVYFEGDNTARNKLIEHYFTPNTHGYSKKRIMLYGKIKQSKTINKSVGYLHIGSFIDSSEDNSASFTTLQPWARDIDGILAKLINTDGLVLDLRQNEGGYPGNMLWIAGRFARTEKHFMNTHMKNGPNRSDFAPAHKWRVTPQGSRRYTKPIVLLTDGGTGSNGEYFTLAMRGFDYVTHIGQNTQGIMGYIMSFEIPNGWALNYTTGYSEGVIGKDSGKNYEQDGIPPKIVISKSDVENTAGYDEATGGGEVDPILDKAIEHLLKKL